ncbi:MAG: response regulator [Candidatus Altiarchaeales archaeon]|nr:response regulator [Candidatus Altiarchaeales archaeon]
MSQKILVVDDEADIRNSVKTLLEAMEYEVREAEDGETCLKTLEEYHPNLILMDFFMPKVSGRETIKKIREKPENQDIKIIFLTVAEFRGEEYMQEFEDLKIDDYIQKPIDTQELLSRVKQTLQ